MKAYGIIAIILILALLTSVVLMRAEISPAQYESLARTAVADPPLIPQIRDAMREGKISKLAYHLIMSDHNGTRKTANAAIGTIIGGKSTEKPIDTQEAKAIIRLLLAKSMEK